MVIAMIEWIMLAVSILVFPGILFLISLSLFTQWYYRKLSGRLQNRMGPTYVGPAGLLQPLMDLWKLIHVKEMAVNKYSLPSLAQFFGLLGISALVVSLLLFPLSPYHVTGPYDFLVFIYLVSLWVPLSMLIMSLSMPGPYTSTGVSRLLTFITLIEPSFFAALLAPVALASARTGIPYSVLEASKNAIYCWANPVLLPVMVLSLIAAIVVLQAKAMFQPFNIPEAEQEIIAGYETEFSGPLLGLASLMHDMDIAVTAIAITYLILGGPYPFPHLSVPGIVLLIVKYMAVVTAATIIKNAFGRYRIEQALNTIFKYALIPAIVALLLAMIYLYG